jgi:hypothetical protein
VSFLPQFTSQPLVAWTFGPVGIHVLLGLLWATGLIAATRPLAEVLRRERVIRWMDRCTGLVFVPFCGAAGVQPARPAAGRCRSATRLRRLRVHVQVVEEQRVVAQLFAAGGSQSR